MAKTLKTISEFLGEIDPWGIFDSAAMKDDFLKSTGIEPKWPEFSEARTKKIMADRGLGGTMPKPSGKMLCYGYTTAIALASRHVPGFQSTKMGRGSSFWEAVEALKKAGK